MPDGYPPNWRKTYGHSAEERPNWTKSDYSPQTRRSNIDADGAGERWRNALAELDYAKRHGSPADEVAQLAKIVIEARVAMFHAGLARVRALPTYQLPA